mgnify:CR=1 FL=1
MGICSLLAKTDLCTEYRPITSALTLLILWSGQRLLLCGTRSRTTSTAAHTPFTTHALGKGIEYTWRCAHPAPASCSCIQMDLDGVVTFVVGWIQGKCTKSSVYSSSKVCLLASVPDLLDTHRRCLADAEVPWTQLAVWKIPTIKTKVYLQWKPLPGQVEMLSHVTLKRIQAKLAQSLHKSEQLQLPLKFMWVTLTYFRFELSQCPCCNSHSNVLLFSAHFTLSTCFDFKAAKRIHFIESQNHRTIKVGRDNWVPPLTHPAALYSRDETHENSVSNILWSSCLAKMVAYVLWTYTHPNPALSNCSRKILDGFDSYFL